MTLDFSKQQLSALWEGSLGMSTQGGGGTAGGRDERQPPPEAFLGQGETVGSSALLQAVLGKIFQMPSGGKGIIN